jgi:hypothetical protein
MSKQRTRSQIGRTNRNKGASAERAVATLLTKGLGVKVKRKLGASREGGSDIELESSSYIDEGLVIRSHPGWSIEVKHQNKYNLVSWWEQTLEQSDKEERRPLLFFRKDREGWNCMYMYDGEPVITDYETWLELYKTDRI